MSIVTQHVQPPIITTYISIPRSAMHLQIRHSNTKSILKKMESATRIAPIWAANMADTFSFHQISNANAHIFKIRFNKDSNPSEPRFSLF